MPVLASVPVYTDARSAAVLAALPGLELDEASVEQVVALGPDLVLMDINMGGIDGIEATTAIIAAHPTIRVVLMSTYELGDLPPSARTSGAIAYVNKDDFGGRALRRLWEAGGDPLFSR